MKTKQLLKELEAYLLKVQVVELSLAMAITGSIGFCLTVAEIVKTYNSTQENEDKVCDLLAALAKKHFSKVSSNSL